MIIRPVVRSLIRPVVTTIDGALRRIFITADAVLNTKFTFSAVTLAGDFDVNIDAILPTDAVTYSLYGQDASASNSIKVLSTGFVSIVIGGSTVTSTVLATKDSKYRNYGVKLIGNDFEFTESGVTIDTVTDAGAAANSLVLDAIAVSNGLNFFANALANPVIDDLTTTSNSESWLLDRPFPQTTEQSSSNSNLLTYVNADSSTRELFTQVGADWLGAEAIPQPIEFSVNWLETVVLPPQSGNSYTTVDTSGQGMYIDHGKIGPVRIKYDVSSGDANWQLRDSINGLLADPLIVTASTPNEAASIDYNSTLGGLYLRHFTTSGITVTTNDLSIKRILEIV